MARALFGSSERGELAGGDTLVRTGQLELANRRVQPLDHVMGSHQDPSVNSGFFHFTDNIRTFKRGKEKGCSPEAAPDKALRIFCYLVRDQKVEGSNPFAPTILPILTKSGTNVLSPASLTTQLRYRLSIERCFQVRVFESGSHAVDLLLGYTVPGGFGAPLRNGFAHMRCYFTGLGRV